MNEQDERERYNEEARCKAEDDASYEGHISDKNCPRCGCKLLINARGQEWCSFVGGATARPCTCGMED